MSPTFYLLLALLHAAIALATTSVNLYVGQKRLATTSRNDMAKLRLALAAELANLRSLYKDNIDAIYAGKDALASCRMVSAIYRGNVGRLHALGAGDIPAVVTAYAMSERVEAYAAVHCKAHGANAFSMGKDRPFADSLVAMYEKAAAAADRALRVLGQSDEGLVMLGAHAKDEPAPRLARA
jgi:hypothetical protein